MDAKYPCWAAVHTVVPVLPVLAFLQVCTGSLPVARRVLARRTRACVGGLRDLSFAVIVLEARIVAFRSPLCTLYYLDRWHSSPQDTHTASG